MEFKKMREYTHEEFVNLIRSLNEEQILELSSKYGGNPVFLRMAFDERICHIPIFQPGSAVIVINENEKILLQQRADNGRWGLPGGCQDLGEDLRVTAVRELYEETGIRVNEDDLTLIDILSGKARRRIYPNEDVVYNNTALYLVRIDSKDVIIKMDSESTRLEFFDINNLPEPLHDGDLVDGYIKYIKKKTL